MLSLHQTPAPEGFGNDSPLPAEQAGDQSEPETPRPSTPSQNPFMRMFSGVGKKLEYGSIGSALRDMMTVPGIIANIGRKKEDADTSVNSEDKLNDSKSVDQEKEDSKEGGRMTQRGSKAGSVKSGKDIMASTPRRGSRTGSVKSGDGKCLVSDWSDVEDAASDAGMNTPRGGPESGASTPVRPSTPLQSFGNMLRRLSRSTSKNESSDWSDAEDTEEQVGTSPWQTGNISMDSVEGLKVVEAADDWVVIGEEVRLGDVFDAGRSHAQRAMIGLNRLINTCEMILSRVLRPISQRIYELIHI